MADFYAGDDDVFKADAGKGNNRGNDGGGGDEKQKMIRLRLLNQIASGQVAMIWVDTSAPIESPYGPNHPPLYECEPKFHDSGYWPNQEGLGAMIGGPWRQIVVVAPDAVQKVVAFELIDSEMYEKNWMAMDLLGVSETLRGNVVVLPKPEKGHRGWFNENKI
jgi:hypothetical protein